MTEAEQRERLLVVAERCRLCCYFKNKEQVCYLSDRLCVGTRVDPGLCPPEDFLGIHLMALSVCGSVAAGSQIMRYSLDVEARAAHSRPCPEYRRAGT